MLHCSTTDLTYTKTIFHSSLLHARGYPHTHIFSLIFPSLSRSLCLKRQIFHLEMIELINYIYIPDSHSTLVGVKGHGPRSACADLLYPRGFSLRHGVVPYGATVFTGYHMCINTPVWRTLQEALAGCRMIMANALQPFLSYPRKWQALMGHGHLESRYWLCDTTGSPLKIELVQDIYINSI